MKRNRIFLISGLIIVLGVYIFLKYQNPSQAEVSLTDLKNNYDVIVVGGEPEGVTAAVSAARSGLEVLLIEERDALGGLFTFGELNYLDIPSNKNGQITSAGIFEEWWNKVGNVSTFDIPQAKEAFLELVKGEENLTLSLNTSVKDVAISGNEITEITIGNEEDIRTVKAKRYIDATADADFAAMAGVPYTYGQEDIGKKDSLMAATLIIHLKNVDWEGVKQAAQNDVLGGGEATDQAAWGFWDIEKAYIEKEEGTNLRGLNIGITPKGDVYINALQIFGVNGLNNRDREKAIEKGKRETERVLQFLKENFPGFEKAQIASYPEELYLRETRHIQSLYRLKASDVWENQVPEDTIAFGAYPVDIQATSPSETNFIVVNPDQYGIPYRSIVPKNITNLLVTSKASGYDSIPAGSARVVPTGMAVAEAGGIAAYVSIKENIDFHELSQSDPLISEVQETLRKQGAYLPDTKQTPYPFENDEDYESIKKLYSLGLIGAGYENKLPLDEKMTVAEFLDLLTKIINQVHANDEEVKKRNLERIQSWSSRYGLSGLMTFNHLSDLLSIFPEVEEDSSWMKTGDKELLTREGYRALALWIPDNYE